MKEKYNPLASPLKWERALELLEQNPNYLKEQRVLFPSHFGDIERLENISKIMKLDEYGAILEISPLSKAIEGLEIYPYEIGLMLLTDAPQKLNRKKIEITSDYSIEKEVLNILRLRRAGAQVILPEQKEENVLNELKPIKIKEELRCPLTKKIMNEPVMLSSGETYEKEAIINWLKEHSIDPVTKEELEDKKFTINKGIQKALHRFLEKNPGLKNSSEYFHSESITKEFLEALKTGNIEQLKRLNSENSWLLEDKTQHNFYFQQVSLDEKSTTVEWFTQTLGSDVLLLNCFQDGGTHYFEEQSNDKSPNELMSLMKILGLSEQEKSRILEQKCNNMKILQQEWETKAHELEQILKNKEQELLGAQKDVIQRKEKYKFKIENLKIKLFFDHAQDNLKQKFKNSLEEVTYLSKIAYERNTFTNEDVTRFLILVSEGNIEEAQKMLEKSPELALAQGDLTDLAKRNFKGITAFQYAVWNLDAPMWTMMQNLKNTLLTPKQAALQYDALKHHRPDITNEHGCHFNFDPLLKAYNDFLAYFGFQRSNNGVVKDINEHWAKAIGGEQTKVPAWYIHAFCEEGLGGAKIGIAKRDKKYLEEFLAPGCGT
ncbi:MAG: U-box domain-containing protein, partial [Legionella longbeachae]|nr:U-box domain-containing protein [Legionella longbeachae]